jgi:hypothetical protein
MQLSLRTISDNHIAGATRSSTQIGVKTPDTRSEEKAFIDAVTGPNLRSGDLEEACEWYIGFLKGRIEEAWIPLFKPVLVGICADCNPCEKCVEKAFTLLKVVVSVFPTKSLTLVTIVDKLYNDDLLREAEGDTEHDRSNACQLAFGTFGWISKLDF